MEMLIVLILLVFILSWSVQKLFSHKSKVGTSLQVLDRLNRSLAARSRLHGKTYRLVLKLSPNQPEEFWVEKQTEEKGQFIPDNMVLKSPGTLHPLVSVVSAESEGWQEAKTEGLVYIHYYPRGLGQEAALHLERGDTRARWTVYFDPVAKELSVIEDHIPLKEIQEDL